MGRWSYKAGTRIAHTKGRHKERNKNEMRKKVYGNRERKKGKGKRKIQVKKKTTIIT